jgi:hypothetical protein
LSLHADVSAGVSADVSADVFADVLCQVAEGPDYECGIWQEVRAARQRLTREGSGMHRTSGSGRMDGTVGQSTDTAQWTPVDTFAALRRSHPEP